MNPGAPVEVLMGAWPSGRRAKAPRDRGRRGGGERRQGELTRREIAAGIRVRLVADAVAALAVLLVTTTLS
ncbi:MAG: hypothetical protein ABIY55_20185, partial [Kofleriaceae bacterium]